MDKLTEHLGQPPERIAVFRAIKLGDLLCAVPAFRALRRAFPHAHIALISLPWASEFVNRYADYIDEFIAFPGWPGLPEQPLDLGKTVAFLTAMQARNWDVVVQMQGNGTLVNAMLALFGAKFMAGYYPVGHPEQTIGDHTFLMPYPQLEHEVKRHVHLMAFLGIPTQGYELEFPISAEDNQIAQQVLNDHQLTLNRYVCIHAGGISGRRWPESQFARVGDALAAKGYGVVLTGTTAEESTIEAVRQQMRYPSVSLAGQTPLGALAAVLKGTAVLVSNDTGVSHVAAACQVPSVVIFTSADPAEWAPLDQVRHRVVLEAAATNAQVVIDETIAVLTAARTGSQPSLAV